MESVIRSLPVDSEDCYFWATHGKAGLDLLVVKGMKRTGYEIKRVELKEFLAESLYRS